MNTRTNSHRGHGYGQKPEKKQSRDKETESQEGQGSRYNRGSILLDLVVSEEETGLGVKRSREIVMSERLILAGLRRNLDRHRRAKDERTAINPTNKAAYLAEFERELSEVNYWAARVAVLDARTAYASHAPDVQGKAA